MEKQTFNVPDGTGTITFEQAGNSIITTFYPKEEEEAEYIPEMGEWYFFPDLQSLSLCREHKWKADEIDILLFLRGLVFKTEAEAIEKTKKMLER